MGEKNGWNNQLPAFDRNRTYFVPVNRAWDKQRHDVGDVMTGMDTLLIKKVSPHMLCGIKILY